MTEKSSESTFMKAAEYMRDQDYERAYELFSNLELIMEDIPELFYNLAVCAYNLNNYNDAAKHIEHAMILKDEAQNYLLTAAKIYSKLDNIPKLIELYEQLLSLDPKNIDFLQNLGFLYLKQEHMEEAVISLQRAVDMGGAEHETVFTLAILLQQSDRDERAIELLEEIRDEGYNLSEVVPLLVEAYINSNKLEKARTLLEERYEREKTVKNASALARVYYKQGQYDQSIDLINQITSEQNNDDLILMKSHMLREKEKFNQALELYNQILARDGRNKSALKGKALTLLELDRVDEANEVFEQGQKLG